MLNLRRPLIVLLAIGLLAFGPSSAHAQDQSYQYFPQTGHSMQGEFLKFYRSISDPTTLYGYPITEEFTSRDGAHVQYLQRARFEFHPEFPEGGRVTLTDLGRRMYAPAVEANVFSPFACRLYAQTNYAVCFTFLEFFDKNGGVAQFGYPISSFEYHRGLIVQYFEKARLEWQPSKPEGQRVVLTDLGRLYFDRLAEDPGFLQAVPQLNGAPSAVISLRVHAFTWKAATLATDGQSLFLIVKDQRGAGLADAACSANVRWPDGRTESVNVGTDSNGVAIAPLSVVDQPSGTLVLIEVTCSYNGLAGTTTTSFRIWY